MIKLNTAALNEIINTKKSYMQDNIWNSNKEEYLVALQQQKASFYNVAAGCC